MRQRRTRRQLAMLPLAALLAVSTASCGSSDPEPGDADDGPVRLKVGTLQSLSLGDFMLADHGGYFADEGIEIEIELIQNSQDAVVLLSQGRLDAVTGSISAGLLNSIAGGLDVRVVSGVSNIAAVPGADDPPPSGVFVRKELADSGELTDYADLAGRKVASVGGLGAATSYLIGLYAAQGGLTLSDVELLPLSVADALAALESDAADVAYLTAPFSQEAVDTELAVELGDAREVYGEVTQSAIMFGPNLLTDDRDAGLRFVRAMSAAADAMQGDYREQDEIVDALVAGSGAEREQVLATPPYTMSVDFNGETLSSMQEMFLELGDLLDYDEPLPYADVVDDEFLAKIGKA